jgi:tricarballylate dehydrogenase
MPDPDLAADVIVVGCGAAGLSAAVAAQQAGASVIVLERAPEAERGGNTRHTGAWLRMESEDAVSPDFMEHLVENNGAPLDPSLVHEASGDWQNWPATLRAASFVDPEVVATFAEQAPPTIAWLKGFGLRFARLEVPFMTSVQPRMAPSGGGLALVESLAAQFESKGGRIHYQVAAQRLLQDEDGAVTGVRCIGPGNRPLDYRGGAVVLACGGFQGNAEMMTRYIGPRATHLGMMSRGCHHNKGEGIRMALEIGAAPCGDFGSWHASPMDPRSSRAGASIYIYPYGVLVNRNGLRFADEAPGPTDETYETLARTINAQPGGIAYAVLDSVTSDLPNTNAVLRTEHGPIEAATLPELAAKLKLPVDAFIATVEAYNAACRPGRYAPMELDGLATQGLAIPKSNWARPLLAPPFKAWPIISSIVFTFGGLRVDPSARVVNLQGDPIPGLYAAGETMGLYYGTYTGATSVLKGLVFGRLAGLDAARTRLANA